MVAIDLDNKSLKSWKYAGSESADGETADRGVPGCQTCNPFLRPVTSESSCVVWVCTHTRDLVFRIPCTHELNLKPSGQVRVHDSGSTRYLHHYVLLGTGNPKSTSSACIFWCVDCVAGLSSAVSARNHAGDWEFCGGYARVRLHKRGHIWKAPRPQWNCARHRSA